MGDGHGSGKYGVGGGEAHFGRAVPASKAKQIILYAFLDGYPIAARVLISYFSP